MKYKKISIKFYYDLFLNNIYLVKIYDYFSFIFYQTVYYLTLVWSEINLNVRFPKITWYPLLTFCNFFWTILCLTIFPPDSCNSSQSSKFSWYIVNYPMYISIWFFIFHSMTSISSNLGNRKSNKDKLISWNYLGAVR